jgi:hypothetical protein
LVDLGRPAEARVEYEKALAAFPNRFNGHLGAARAAERADEPEVARRHYQRLVDLAGAGDGRREEIEQARRYLALDRADATAR